MKRDIRRRFGHVIGGALWLIVGLGTAEAATFTVNSTADTVDASPGNGVCADASGACTLRAAIMEANALGGADTITLPAGTYTLTIPGTGENAAATGDLDVTGTLTINGAGALITIVDGGGLDRVFEIRPGANVQINGVTIRNGRAAGGGIDSDGGGIFNFGATLTLNGVILSNNTAAGFGGAMMIDSSITTLTNTTVNANTAIGGGGIFNRGTLTLNGSTVSNNRAPGSGGGGIFHDGGAATLANTTVSGNTAVANGGGIFNGGTVLTLTNSTVAGNSAGGASGILNGSTIANSTIVANNPGGDCGGLAVLHNPSNYNLSSDGTCVFTNSGDLSGINPLLGPLASNGGATATHALLSTSSAIDAVPPASCSAGSDQRGVGRPQGAGCDMGAFETVPPAACLTPPAGLIGWWPMDENAGATQFQDVVGGNHATPSASPVGASQAPQPVPGVVGGAIQYPKFGNGLSGSRVSPQGALAAVGAADFSIDAWVLVPPAPANRLHYLVNKFDTGTNRGYALYVLSPGVAGDERLEFKWGDGANVSTLHAVSLLTTGSWHHVAVTFKRTPGTTLVDVRLYVDGVQQGQQSGAVPGFGSLANVVFLEIGWQPGTSDEPIAIDELEIFDVALGPSDVQAIYSAGSAGKCKCTTGGQSVDLTVAATGAVFGTGLGTGATVSGPLTINYAVQGCSGREMFAIVRAPAVGIPNFQYYSGALATFLPLPNPLSFVTPFVTGGPLTTNGSHTIFSGTLPTGTYDLFLGCDLFVNGHLDLSGPPACLSGAFDYLPLTVQ